MLKKKPSTTKLPPIESSKVTSASLSSSSSSSNFESYTISRQLDKKQRFDIYLKRLRLKPACSTSEQAIELLNGTMIEVEDKYAPQPPQQASSAQKATNKFYAVNSKRYGRMHPIPSDRIKINKETGRTELFSVGLITYIQSDGSFEMWTVPRGKTDPKRIFKKSGFVDVENKPA